MTLALHNYYKRRRIQDLQTLIHVHVSPFWRGVLTAITAFASNGEIEIGDGHSTRFWLDRWVGNDTLAMKFPNLFGLALDPSAMVGSQMCPLDGSVFRPRNFEDGFIRISLKISTTSSTSF